MRLHNRALKRTITKRPGKRHNKETRPPTNLSIGPGLFHWCVSSPDGPSAVASSAVVERFVEASHKRPLLSIYKIRKKLHQSRLEACLPCKLASPHTLLKFMREWRAGMKLSWEIVAAHRTIKPTRQNTKELTCKGVGKYTDLHVQHHTLRHDTLGHSGFSQGKYTDFLVLQHS
jgi:hypothetical protein